MWLGGESVRALPETPVACREARNGGRHEELAELLRKDAELVSRPLEAWIAGESLLALNRAAEALEFAARVETALPRSFVGAYLRQREALARGDTASARSIVKQRMAQPDAGGYGWGRQPVDWLLLGRMRLMLGEDAKNVLQSCYERALRDDPACEEAHEAVVELALERGDAQMAAKRAREALKKFAANPRLHVLLGDALEWTSRKEALAAWRRALELSPGESSACAALARYAFELEDADLLKEQLKKLPAWHAEARALRLAEAVAGSDAKRARALREEAARSSWVLHRAAVLLSGRYRFAEGVELNRAALALDPELSSASRSLAEDLLRTGRAEEAWPLLEAAHKADGYDVTAYNLLELRDRVASFTRLETPHFEIWMDPAEAPVYGDRVGELLEKAYAALTPKYGFKPPGRTRIEIFPNQKDFAVRSFGVPGGDGFLGICFGTVITAPSPASPRAVGHSWEATLWHEFTHTITLSMTRNRLPRWLSEGISVFEEQQANPAWGRRFRARYAPRILGGKLTPVQDMPESFRGGDSASMDFAYLQAGLFVEFLHQRGGMDKLRKMLAAIGRGMDTDEAIATQYGPFVEINPAFQQYASNWVRKMGGTLGFKAAADPDNPGPPAYEELVSRGRKAVAANQLEDARASLEKAVEGAPQLADSSSAYPLLTEVYRSLGLEKEEAQLWERGLAADADLAGAHERLLELYLRAEDWEKLEVAGRRSLGVNPMALSVLEALWKARRASGRALEAVDACRRALALDPGNGPRWHSRIGQLLEAGDPAAARVHLREALESNPRDLAALQALGRILERTKKEKKP